MRGSRFRSTSCLILVLLVVVADLSAQRRGDLPRPDSSRAPLLTRASADSIRYQTASLHLAKLLQALQAADAPVMGVLLENAALGSTTCGSLRAALANVGTRARKIALSDGRTSLALFFDKIKIADSGTVQVVTADLVIVSASSGQPMRSSVMLVLDPERAVWSKENGLLETLCSS